MRVTALVVVFALVGCSPSSSEDTSTTAAPTTTAPTPTTTTIDPAVVTAATCDALKIASFDLDHGVTESLAGSIPASDAPDLADGEVGRIITTELVEFYDRVGSLAPDAPDEVADSLTTVAGAVDPWREALAAPDGDLAGLEDLDPATLRTPEVVVATEELRAWTEKSCGAAIPLDLEEILFTTVFSAMFGAFGSKFDEFGSDLLDRYGEPDDVPDGATFAVAYGDDPTFDALHDRCGAGEGSACRDLYFSAFGEYELWGQTCGARIPLRPAFVVDCDGKFAAEPSGYGESFVLDSLWDECRAGDAASCDGLFGAAPFGSGYENYGATCGGTREPVDVTRPCSFAATGEPFGYGDDPAFDLLWNTCAGGDETACYDLFLQTPINSAYEAFGRVCGDLTEVGQTCENPAAWLNGPGG